MTVPYLPDDCVIYLLNYLQNYHSTLFNCLLVNRFWCKATVPLLYANPFDHSTNKNHSSIILTLILCFNKAEILQLKNQLKLVNINININDDYKPLFEYSKYLENFNHFSINGIIFKWIESYLSLSYNQRIKVYTNFIPIFRQSILRQCISIKRLNIPLHLLYEDNEKYKNWNWNVQSFTTNLTKLISLTLHFDEINNKITLEFLNSISNFCLNLKRLEIASTIITPIDINNEKLCTIIQKQNHLKEITLSSYCKSFLNDIFLSLEFQKNSLVYVEFKDIHFINISFKNFINLYNLRYLKFHNCNGTMISLDHYEVLKYASFKLKRLEFKFNKWIIRDNELITSSMIEYLGTPLQELIIIGDKLNIPMMENILTYCLNLIKLEIKIESDIDPLVFYYIKNLKIRILNIIIGCSSDLFTNLEIIEKLASNLPINVKEVFLNPCELYFEGFLENCHDCLEVININSIHLMILEIILNYTERSNGSLKLLGVYDLKRVLNEEETKLLNQIRAKGVKIVYLNRSFESRI